MKKKKLTSVKKTKTVDPNKVNQVYEELVGVFKNQSKKLTETELLLALGNLVYTIGASMGGYKSKGPTATELDRMYAEKPSVDVALMMTGLTICSWEADLEKKYEEILAELKAKKENAE